MGISLGTPDENQGYSGTLSDTMISRHLIDSMGDVAETMGLKNPPALPWAQGVVSSNLTAPTNAIEYIERLSLESVACLRRGLWREPSLKCASHFRIGLRRSLVNSADRSLYSPALRFDQRSRLLAVFGVAFASRQVASQAPVSIECVEPPALIFWIA